MSKGSAQRKFRLDDDQLWNDFAKACAEEGTDRSEVLRTFIRHCVAEWREGQQIGSLE